jgi:purine-binding chemotaxis protein CheW
MTSINQYLTFALKSETYAISVASIREVLEVPQITHVPRMPPFMKGVINLRGSVVPVLDLASKFGLGDTAHTASTAIIVLEIPAIDDDGVLHLGIFADCVYKVITIDKSDIDPVPKIGLSVDADFLEGMGKVEGNFVMMLNITEILTTKDIGLIVEQVSPDSLRT